MNCIDVLSAEKIKSLLSGRAKKLIIECRSKVTSTNNILKENTAQAECVLIAQSQTAGKGRLGRSFFSPDDTGLYLSILLKPDFSVDKLPLLTPAAAVAACRALEKQGCSPKIKWVNDLYINNRKVCGILTETVYSKDNQINVIVGIGINIYAPENGFPEDISSIAGNVFEKRQENLRNTIAADFINFFIDFYSNIEMRTFLSDYKGKSCVTGQYINVLKAGECTPAYALNINDDCQLVVRYNDGTTEALYSGEISIRIDNKKEV